MSEEARRSTGIIRYQPIATITIPTNVRMNILAAGYTGDISDYFMIGGGCKLRVIEMKSDPLGISSPVFRFHRYATVNHSICQE